MTTAVTSSPTPILQFFSNNGQPLYGGSVLTTVGGVNTPTYQDANGTIPLPNPIPLNSRGEVSNTSGISSQLFLTNGVAYTFTLFDALGNQINQASYVVGSGGTAGAGFTAITITSDNDGLITQLLTSAGDAGVRWNDQIAARKAEAIFWGTTSTPTYGMTAGSFGLNTPAGVPMTFGTGDAVRQYIDPTTGLVGIGLAPTAAQGRVQTLGDANGGIKLGNVNNVYPLSLDWYEEGTWTPTLLFGAGAAGMLYGTRLGTFTRIGNTVLCRFRIALTGKGTSTGTAVIGSLPYVPLAAGSISDFIFAEFLGMTALTAGVIYGLNPAGAGSPQMYVVAYDTTGGLTTVITRSDAAFLNGSVVDASFSYQVA